MVKEKNILSKSQSIHTWWGKKPEEVFWLEVTGRTDIGINLKAPQVNEHGAEFWSYSLLKYVRQGDVVFHYDRKQKAIVSCSKSTGEFWSDNITWAARGTYAREAKIQPHIRPGWYVGLEDYKQFKNILELEIIRVFQIDISKQQDQLIDEVGPPLYFPFEIGDVRPMRPMQGYLFKLPYYFVTLFYELLGEYNSKGRTINDKKIGGNLGEVYRIADVDTSVGERDPFSVDPALVERGMHGHATTQNSLAEFPKHEQLLPLSPRFDEPNYDIAWKFKDEIWIAEVKSITNANEEKQLRLGLGQVLRYCHLLKPRGIVHGVLAIERAPSDTTWIELCEAHNIQLVWPEIFPQLIKMKYY